MTLIDQISKTFNGAVVGKVVIDREFGNVTATVNGRVNTDCGFLEDFTFSGEVLPACADVFMDNELDGKFCRVTGIFPNADSANSYMMSENGENCALLAESQGIAFTAHVDDLGVTLESVEG